MADDPRYRSQRSDRYVQDRTSRSTSGPQDDPLAELARLIGQDEAFIAAGREGTRARDRDPEPERDSGSGSAPSWLSRIGQRSTPTRGGEAGHETETGRQHPGHFSDLDLEADRPPRQTIARWQVGADEEESRYDAPGDDARHEWDERRYDPAHPAHEEAVNPYRIAGQDDRYDRLPQGAESYSDRDGAESHIDPFDSLDDRIDHAADDGHGSRLRRRGGVLTFAAVLGLAAVGTAAAFGYRAWTSGSSTAGQPPLIKADTAPTKVVPAQSGDGQQSKLIYDRIGEKIQQSTTDKMISREEQPLELRDMARQPSTRSLPPSPGTPGSVTIGAQPPAYTATAPATGGNAGPNEPKKVHTITIRPDQVSTLPAPGEAEALPTRSVPTGNIGPTAAPTPPAARSPATAPSPIKPLPPRAANGGPLALNPPPEPSPAPRSGATPAQSAPYRTAALPSAAEAGNYVVQISSQRSESEAQASFRALQAKYPGVLGSRQPLIRRADLGSKGVFYRAQVGPFASAEDANQLCSNLKAAGGQCIVQRN
jgi:hypothetical protein